MDLDVVYVGYMSTELTTFRKSRPLWQKPNGVEDVINHWQETAVWQNVSLHHRLSGRSAQYAALPADLATAVKDALQKRGIHRLFAHQVEAYDAVKKNQHVVIATPTASGKSLCYQLPILDCMASDPSARALYLFPTKALSRDQEAATRQLMSDANLDQGAVTFDGDTPGDARRAAKARAGCLMTNPDMLHAGILPHHASWVRLFSNLKFVVIDELHIYRGVFGSHLSNVVRRLRRIARYYGSEPQFIFASATIGNPQEHAQRILGADVYCIRQNGAPAGDRDLVVYNPPVVNQELGIRQSHLKATVKLDPKPAECTGRDHRVWSESDGGRGDVEVSARVGSQ